MALTEINRPDSVKAQFGDSDDLQIYHDGSDSFIKNTTGGLNISTSDGNPLFIRGGNNMAETLAKFTDNGAVELYNDNVKIFQTDANGIQVIGPEGGSANLYLYGDEGDDNNDKFVFIANANEFYLQNYASGSWETNIKATGNGAVELHCNNHKSLETNTEGIVIRGAEANHGVIYLYADEGDDNADMWSIQAKKTASTFTIQNNNAGAWDNSLKCHGDGAVELYYDNTKRFETTSSGIKVTGANSAVLAQAAGEVSMNIGSTDAGGAALYFDGDSNGDFVGADYSHIRHTTGGDMEISCDSPGQDSNFYVYHQTSGGQKTGIYSGANGAVKLYYDGDLRFETDSQSINVFGDEGESCHIYMSADQADDQPDQWRLKADHAAASFYLQNYAGGNWDHTNIKANGGGSVELYHNNTKTFETASTGCSVTGQITVTRADQVATFNCNTSSDVAGIVMRHGRGGLSGYSGTMITFRGNDESEEGSIVIGTSATAYNQSSDYRLKENEVAISDGITRLKKLKPYRFNWKKDPNVTVDGFFAHEITPAVPEAVHGDKDATNSDGSVKPQQIDKSKLVPLLTAALQEAISKIETLETKVAALEAA